VASVGDRADGRPEGRASENALAALARLSRGLDRLRLDGHDVIAHPHVGVTMIFGWPFPLSPLWTVNTFP
jgi:hypothetical protein